MNLRNNWNVEKHDINNNSEAFECLNKSLKLVSDNIRLKTIRPNQISIFTVNDEDDQNFYGFWHTADGTLTDGISKKDLKNEEMMQETASENLWIIKIAEDYYFASYSAVTSMGIQTDLNGRYLLKTDPRARFYRDGAFMTALSTKTENINVVYREEDGVKKIFYFGSEIFKLIPQDKTVKLTLKSFEKEMGDLIIKGFSVSNFRSVIQVEFPKKADDFSNTYGLKDTVTPGLRIQTSDVGESSYIVQGTIKVNDSLLYVPKARYARKHTKEAQVEDIVNNLEKTVFPEYTKMPERLAELMLIDIKDPEKTAKAVGEFLNISGAIGKKAEKNMVKEIAEAINPTIPYTAYDIAMLFLEAGAEYEENMKSKTEENLGKLRNTFVQAIFYKYED